jgi:hypothetical protein
MATSLGEYFNGLTDVLTAKGKLAGDSSENIDIGANREVICHQFLEKHVPKRFTINLGGDIFGVGNARSGQVDVIINHDMSMNFLENHKPRCPVESVTAAISVKSTLTKKELFSALNNLASIPQTHPSVITLGPLKPSPAEYALSWPALFVVAFDGVAPDTLLTHLTDFYSAQTVAFNRIPRAIVVNGKYILTFTQYSVPGATVDTRFDPAFLKGAIVQDSNRGQPLFWMMHELAKGLSWLDGMYLDYEAYYNESFK